MKEIAKLLGEMVEAGIITDYALFGATAQMRYTAPVATVDADVLVAVPGPEKLDLLSPLYAFCASRGYVAEGEAVAPDAVGALARNHGLDDAWSRFEARFLND